jgi:hypothetical protein
MSEHREYESVKRPFTDAELAEMHEALVQRVGDVKALRGQKSQTNTEINAAIKGAEKAVWDLQEKLTAGYELVDVGSACGHG